MVAGAETMFKTRYSALWVLFVLLLLVLTPAFGEIQLSNLNPQPGETVYFNGTVCFGENSITSSRFLIKEPSGRYAESPSYLSISITPKGTCMNQDDYKEFYVNGSIKTDNNFAAGKYSLIINLIKGFHEDSYYSNFTVGSYSGAWKYTFHPPSNWYAETLNDSSWQTGYMPFGNPSLFPGSINTTWSGDDVYVRKEVYLDSYTQAHLKMFAENTVSCYVNGKYVGGHDSITALNSGNCYTDNFYYGKTSVFSTDDSYTYNGIKYLDISKYLKPGKNVIACQASIFDDVFYVGTYVYPGIKYYPGRQFLDVEFLPLQKNDMFWSTNSFFQNYDKLNWYNTGYAQQSTYYEYDCRVIGDSSTTHRYIKTQNWHGSWQWNALEIKDGTIFFAKPNHFNWAWDYIDKRIYTGTMPYDSTTYFRKWIWSDVNETKTLKISDTKMPTCYLNEQQLTLLNYNHNYWRYYTNVNLKKGLNLLACSSSKLSTGNQFNYQLAEVNGPLTITDVQIEGDLLVDSLLRFTPVIENANHPEANVNVFMEISYFNPDSCTYVTDKVSSCDGLENCSCPVQTCGNGMLCILSIRNTNNCNWTHEVCNGAIETEIFTQSIQSENLPKSFSLTDAFVYIPRLTTTYNITIAAIDLIDGDIDTYFGQLEISQAPEPQKVGFLPVAGSSSEEGNTGSNSNLIAIAGTIAIGTAALAGAYVYTTGAKSSSSRSLRRLNSSLNNVSSSLTALLNSALQNSIVANTQAFNASVAAKYQEYQAYLERIKKEKEALRELRKQIIAEREARLKEESAKVFAMFLDEYNDYISKLKDLQAQLDAIYAFIREWRDYLTADDRKTIAAYADKIWKQLHPVKEPDDDTQPVIPEPQPTPIPDDQDNNSWWTPVWDKISSIAGPLLNGITNFGSAMLENMGNAIVWMATHIPETIAAILIGIGAAVAMVSILALMIGAIIVEDITVFGIPLTPVTIASAIVGMGFIWLWASTSWRSVIEACWSDKNTPQCQREAMMLDVEIFLILITMGIAKGVSGIVGKYTVVNSGDKPIITEVATGKTVTSSEFMTSVRSSLKTKGIAESGMTDEQALIRYREIFGGWADSEPIVPKTGKHMLTEDMLRSWSESHRMQSTKTPDQIVVENNKIGEITQEYTIESGSKDSTIANKIFEDIFNSIEFNKNAKDYGLDSNADFKIKIDVNGAVPKNLKELMIEDINKILNGEEPSLLPSGYKLKSQQDLIAVRDSLANGKVTIEATSETPSLNNGGTQPPGFEGLSPEIQSSFNKYLGGGLIKEIKYVNENSKRVLSVTEDGLLEVNNNNIGLLNKYHDYYFKHESMELTKIEHPTFGKSGVTNLGLSKNSQNYLFESINHDAADIPTVTDDPLVGRQYLSAHKADYTDIIDHYTEYYKSPDNSVIEMTLIDTAKYYSIIKNIDPALAENLKVTVPNEYISLFNEIVKLFEGVVI